MRSKQRSQSTSSNPHGFLLGWWPVLPIACSLVCSVQSYLISFPKMHSVLQRQYHAWLAATAKSLQLCPTLCNRRDGSPPGSPVPGILQARTLEWVAIAFSNAWKWKVKSESEVAQSCPTPSDPMDCSLPGSSIHGIFQAGVLEWGAIAFFDAWLRITLLKTGLYAQWAASQKLQLEWHFFFFFCLAKKALLHHPGAQTPVHPVGEGFLLFYWNYIPENSYSGCSLRVWFVIPLFLKYVKELK